MKKSLLSWSLIFFLAVTLVLMTTHWAMAEEASSDWRPTYDLAMRWVNFAILAFLIVKYARKPLTSFFKEKSEEVKREIETIESEKQEILAKINEMNLSRDESQQKLETLKERIIKHGKAKKQRIIDDANKESKIMLEGAQRKMDSQILAAQEKIRSELIDQAISMAMHKLPEEIVEKDNQKLYDQYLENTENLSAL